MSLLSNFLLRRSSDNYGEKQAFIPWAGITYASSVPTGTLTGYGIRRPQGLDTQASSQEKSYLGNAHKKSYKAPITASSWPFEAEACLNVI
jgi:hypothetical protein